MLRLRTLHQRLPKIHERFRLLRHAEHLRPAVTFTRLANALLLTTTCFLTTTPTWAAPVSRFDTALFVCQSLDPTNSRLNLRSQPRGIVKDTISRKELFYIWGADLNRTQHGYVPIHFRRPETLKKTGPTPKDWPSGWVWKAYITCELSN